MKFNTFDLVDNKSNYIMAVKAITNEKTDYTQEEKEQLLAIYTQRAAKIFGFEDDRLVKAVVVLDTAPENGVPEGSPVADLLSKADLDGLTTLCRLCKIWQVEPEQAEAARSAALTGDPSDPMSLALARAALDVLAGQNDLAPHRESIRALANFLELSKDETFSVASLFLLRVRERVR